MNVYRLLLLAALVGCRDTQGGTNVRPTADAGSQVIPCSQTSECGGRGICVAGLCQEVTSCTDDTECAADGKVCHNQRFFCVECDGRNQCGAGRTCQFDFTCVDIVTNRDAGVSEECSGSCNDRTMCTAAQVCKMGECCPPPARCRSPEDCPMERPECNGATGQCFGGDGCFTDNECATRPGCAAGACFCDLSGGSPGACRVRPDECASDMDCFENGSYAGKFCTLRNPPRRCVNAPPCNSDAECANDGLVCDTMAGSPSQGRCVNGTPCPNGNECNAQQACVNGVCVGRNCINTPSLCTANERCEQATGMCVPVQGNTCSRNEDCPTGQWCNGTTCAPGCRDNAECPGGVCNAAHQCEFPTGNLCGPCASDTDCPAGARCVNSPFAGMICYEQCSSILMDPCTANPMAQCIFGNCSCIL